MTVDVSFLLSQQFSKQASSACSRTIGKRVYARAGEEKKTCFSSDSSSLVFLLCIRIVVCAKRLVCFAVEDYNKAVYIFDQRYHFNLHQEYMLHVRNIDLFYLYFS